MKKFILLFAGILILASCSNESVVAEQEVLADEAVQNPDLFARDGIKVDVCHKNAGELVIGEDAVQTHIDHGDAVDMDGDGFFHIDNPCSATDLDDTIAFDQSTLVDADGDGFYHIDNPFSETDCDDNNAAVYPGATEVPYDGIDNDCDALTLDDDLDEDGFIKANDCDDADATRNPGATEICGNGIDDNCDGNIDEGCIPTVTSLTGRIWMDRNLGASQVATSSDDAASYGDLYQWGRGTDGHQLRTSGYITVRSSTDTPGHGDFIITLNNPPNDWRIGQNENLWQGVNGINNPCPSGFRVPTETEWIEEKVTWSSQNSAGAFGSVLKLPMAGVRLDNDSGAKLKNEGIKGLYSSVTPIYNSTSSGYHSVLLDFSDTNAVMIDGRRARGRSVRCIKD